MTQTKPRKLTATVNGTTVSRRTARTYTHVVVATGTSGAYEARQNAEKIKASEHYAARYRQILALYAAGVPPEKCIIDARPGIESDVRFGVEWLKTGEYARWLREAEESIAALKAARPTDRTLTKPCVLGWCGRLDLAVKLAERARAEGRLTGIQIVAVNPEP